MADERSGLSFTQLPLVLIAGLLALFGLGTKSSVAPPEKPARVAGEGASGGSAAQKRRIAKAAGELVTAVLDPDSPKMEPPPFFAPIAAFLGTSNSDYYVATDSRIRESATLNRSVQKILAPYSPTALIALLPDPSESRSPYRFDLWIEAIQQAVNRKTACSSTQYVLDRYYAPWKREGPPAASENNEGRRHAGLLLFRSTQRTERVVPAPSVRMAPDLLLVFLVGETLSAGIHHEALVEALDFIDANEVKAAGWYEYQHCTSPEPYRRAIRIVGPTFSGSQTSLELALQRWRQPALRRSGGNSPRCERPRFEVIASATAIDVSTFKNALVNTAPGSWLAATAVPDEQVFTEMIRYLQPTGCRIARLREVNTGYGSGLKGSTKVGDLVDIPFPLNISEIHAARDRADRESGIRLPALQAFDRGLPIPIDADPQSDGFVPTYGGQMTTVLQEGVLTRIAETLNSERFHYVAIMATDNRDKLFLASVVKQHCPDAQLLMTVNSGLFTHPEYRRVMLGTIVGSCYPLSNAAEAARLVDRRKDQPRVAFSEQSAQAYYNAVLAHLGKWDAMLDYSAPTWFRKNPTRRLDKESSDLNRPGIWISRIGADDYYPLSFIPLSTSGPLSRSDATVWPTESVTRRCLDDESLPARVGSSVAASRMELPEPVVPMSRSWEILAFLLLTGLAVVHVSFWKGLCGDTNLAPAATEASDSSNLKELGKLLTSQRYSETYWLADALRCLWWGVILAINCVLLWVSSNVVAHALSASMLFALGSLLLTILSFGALVVTICRARQQRDLRTFVSATSGGLAAIAIVTVLGILGVHAMPVDQIAVLRNIHVTSGLSLLVPLLVLSVTVLAWIYLQLKRMLFADELMLPRVPRETEQVNDGLLQKYEKLEQLAEPVRCDNADDFWSKFKQFVDKVEKWTWLLGLAALVSGSLVWQRLWLPPIEGSFASAITLLLTGFVVASIILEMGRLVRLWKLIHRLNDDIAELPLLSAFDRLPAALVHSFGKWMFLDRPRSGVHYVVRQQLDHLHEVLAAMDKSSPLEEARVAFQSLAEARKTHGATDDVHFPNPGGSDARKEKMTSLKDVRRLVRELGAHLKTHVWPQLAASAAYDRTSAAADGDKSKKETKPARVTADAAPWIEPAEDLLTMFTVVHLSQFRLHLKNIAWFLLLAPIALLLAVTMYPFQPQYTLMWNVVAVAGAALAALAYVFLGMNRDVLISRITRTNAGWITFDSNFLQSVGVFIVPLALMLLFQIPGIGDTVRGWMESLGSVLSRK